MFSRSKHFLLPLLALLAGCSTAGHIASPVLPATTTTGFHGAVHGGQQPIVGATINIYAVGTTGDGSAASSVLAAPLTTDANGFFDLTNKVTCPTPSSLLYLVATGGNPGLPPPANNLQSSLIVALGQCSNPSNVQFINVNEVTTVAAIYALAPYIGGLTSIGSGSSDLSALSDAFTLAWQYANITNGTSPGSSVPDGVVIPSATINSLANLLSACVNSSGGTAGNTNFCGQLFTLLTPTGGTAPTDTAMALLNLALDPSLNTTDLYNLILPTAPFQPTLHGVPVDFSIRRTFPGGLTVTPGAIDFGAIPVGLSTPSELGSAALIAIYPPTPYPSNYPSVGQVTLAGPNAADFRIFGPPDTSCVQNSYVINQGFPCQIDVVFTPSAAGVRKAYIVVENGSQTAFIIPLTGTGGAPPPPPGPLNLSTSYLAFSTYNDPQSVLVTNANATGVVINGISINPSSGFTQTNNCGSILLAHTSCNIDVSLSNISGNDFLDINSSASSTQTVSLIYQSGAPFVPPSSLNFGGQSVGATSSLVWVGDGGRTSGFVSLDIDGPNASDFSFDPTNHVTSGNCHWGELNPCQVTVFFTPSATGLRTATIFASGVGNTPISGTGQ